MKRISIITLFGLPNFGNRLQSYALNELVRSFGYESQNLIEKKKSNIMLLNPFLAKIFHYLIHKEGEYNRYSLFRQFDRENGIYNRLYSKYYNKKTNAYIIGSDQVWNPYIAGSDFYFGFPFAKGKCITYAASFSVPNLPREQVDRYSKRLSEIYYISVREKTGADIIYELIDRNVPVLSDPTMLIDEKQWKAISKKPSYKCEDDYLLTYFIGMVDIDTQENIRRIAENNNLRVISLEARNINNEWLHTGPAEFLWLLEHARLICTDSFHGTVFSILFKKPFIVYERKAKEVSMMSRLDTLLSIFEFTDRKANMIKIGNEFDIDYSNLQVILENERKKAKYYLEKALNDLVNE